MTDMMGLRKKVDIYNVVHLKYTFVGPLQLIGMTPFHIVGVDAAYKILWEI